MTIRRSLFRALVLALLIAAPAAAVQAQPTAENKRVLILFNNDSYTSTQVAIDRALRTTLKDGSSVPVETYSEYVGNTRSGTGYEKEFVELLRQKYEGKKFDVIYAIGQFPLRVLLQNRAELFPTTPIVSVAVDRRLVADMYPAAGMTGVWGEIDFKSNLELALALHPGTKRVVMIHGVSETDNDWVVRSTEDFREYESRVEFTRLSGLTVPEMREALGGLPPDTIVFFVSSIRDKAGNTYESPDYLRQIESASAAPIYGSSEGQLGMGIVGGRLVSFDSLGAEAGRVGLRLLAGESPDAITPHAVENVAAFDSRQLQRWNIDESSLPSGSVVRFKQPSVWEEYKWYAIALFTALIIESFLIALLVYLRVRRRQAEAESLRLSGRLAEIVSNVPGIVWESRTDPAIGGRRTTFISDYVQRIMGYTPEEWLREPPGFGFDRVAEEDRERVKRESEAVVETGQDGVSEFRWRTKDGQIRWVENYLSPLVGGDGDIVGLRGVALDVTDRKRAQEKAREAEEKDKAILSAIPDLMFIQTLDGTYVDYHAADLDELFVPPERFLGKNLRDIMPPDLAVRFSERFERAKDGEAPGIVEYKLNMSGEDRWFEARMVLTGERILSIVRDITDRKRAEADVVFKSRMLNAVEEAAIATDLQGGIFYWNRFAETLYGCPAAEAIGQNIRDILTSDNPPDRAAAIWEQLRKGTPWMGEMLVTRRDGSRVQIWVNNSPIYDGEELVGILGISHDITERKAAEAALLESESFNRSILSSLNSHVCVLDRSGRIISVNPAWSAFARDNGAESDRLVGPGVDYLDVCRRATARGDEIAGQALEGVRAVCDGTRESFSLEYPCHSPTQKRWFLMVVTPLKGDKGGAVIVHNDVSDTKLAAEAVRESEERFRNMAETAPVMIWLSNETQATTYVNKQWLELTGGKLEDEVGSSWSKHLHPDDAGATLEKYRAAYEEKVPFELEFRMRRSDGEFRWIIASATPRFGPEGKLLGYIGSAVDITERKKAESELKQANDELRQLKNQLEAENIYLQEELRQDQSYGDIVGQSSAIKYVHFKIAQVAPTDSTVLIMGETGTGKELVARAIHEASRRSERPLIKVNCAALSPTLIESELFGHERGAFTGAAARRLGRFELANTGTLLLDEIGELPLDLQAKLLRVLQDGEFERVGGAKTIKTDVRLIASTNRDLKQAAEHGKFREDLWYRLNVFPITTPPLRDRRDDIPILTEHFAKGFARKLGKNLTGISPETLNALTLYTWPGNVRELANVIERAIINLRGTVLKIQEDFRMREAETLATSVKTLDDNERDHILRVLEDLDWRIGGPGGAARILGINPSTLRTRMAKLGIQRPDGQRYVTSER